MKKPWWETDEYDVIDPMPPVFEEFAGPEGVALVKAWPDGRTSAGWGLTSPKPGQDGFIKCYARKEFLARRVLYGFERDKWAFAFVMRSVSLICVDIDGKNGGLEHVKKLGSLPVTLAETSKSGDGYHLFYEMDDVWSETVGFGRLGDRIGIEQGVDIRAVGCVYHFKQQRWNGRRPAKLPAHLYDTLLARAQKVEASKARIKAVLDSEDELEILMLRSELDTELKKPIPDGKRNQTLFAIGSQLFDAGEKDWEEKIRDRANEVGLPQDETDKLIRNIPQYAGQHVPGLSP
jgi:hypothetical protein